VVYWAGVFEGVISGNIPPGASPDILPLNPSPILPPSPLLCQPRNPAVVPALIPPPTSPGVANPRMRPLVGTFSCRRANGPLLLMPADPPTPDMPSILCMPFLALIWLIISSLLGSKPKSPFRQQVHQLLHGRHDRRQTFLLKQTMRTRAVKIW
jgi:hypothetical protein